jgi:hypothetical protein
LQFRNPLLLERGDLPRPAQRPRCQLIKPRLQGLRPQLVQTLRCDPQLGRRLLDTQVASHSMQDHFQAALGCVFSRQALHELGS